MSRSRIIAGKAVIVIEAKDMLDKTFTGIRNKMHRFANTMGDIGENLLRTGFFGSLASGGVFRQFMKFDDLMLTLQTDLNMFGTEARKTEPKLISLEKKIRELGQTTSFSAVEVAESAIRLAKAGIEPGQIEVMLQSILDLSRATSTELETATNVFVRAISAFSGGSEGFQEAIMNSEALVSQFILATRAGVVDLTDFDASLRYVQGTAAGLEQTMARTLAVLTQLSNQGLVGSIGGTSLNTMFGQLAKKKDDLEAIGVVFERMPDGTLDTLGTMKSLFEVVRKMTNGEVIDKIAIFQDVFNLRGARPAIALSLKGIIDQVSALELELLNATNQGRVSAQIMDQGVGGAFRKAKAAAYEFGLIISETVEVPVTNFLRVLKELINELGKLAKQNPVITGSILLSPVAILGAGLAFVALSKAIRLVAGSLGLLRAAYNPVANLFAKGTVVQLSTLLRKKRDGSAPGIFQSASNLSGSLKAAAVSHARSRQQGRLQRTLLQQAQYEQRLARIMALRGVASSASIANQQSRASLTRQHSKAAGMFSRLSGGARGAALAEAGKNVLQLGKAFLTAANAIRRFVFSAGGILTIIESLLLFTDIGDRVARAFGGMFREIGKIGTYASGPMELFKVAFEAFKQQDTATGMQALTNGFSLLVDIIGTQLVAALAAFKKGLGPVWDTLRAIGTTIVVLMDAAVASIGAALTGVSQVVSSVASGLSSSTPEGAIAKLKGLKGKNTKDLLGTQSTTASVAQSIISAILEAVRQQEYFIADMTALLRNFINDLKTVLFPTNLLGYAENRREIEDDRNLAKSAADTRLNNALELVNAAFTRSAELEGGEALANANKAAREAMNEALDRAKELAKQIADNRLTVQAPDGGAPPTPQKQAQQVKDAAKEGLRSLAALVGFAGDTRRNVLLYGQDLEKKQVELLKDIRDDQRKQMQNEGILFTQ